MKVRHVTAAAGRMPRGEASQPASGIVGATLSLAASQVAAGCDVEVWGWNDLAPAAETMMGGIRTWTSPTWPWARFAHWDVRWLAPVWQHTLARPPADILHVHADPTMLSLPGARARLLHLHTPLPEPFPAAYRRLLHRAGCVVCCSHFVRARFLAASGYHAVRAHVIYNGAEPPPVDAGADRATAKPWAPPGQGIVILFAGAIVPPKGVHHLVRAFARIDSAVPGAQLHIAGSARLWAVPGGNLQGEAYEQEVRHLARGLNVHFLGDIPRSQMGAVYSAADIVCVPSVWDEPFGMVACEAMAAGKPVVASAVGGIPEIVVDGETGLLAPPGDETALAEAILALANNPPLRTRMGQGGRERAALFTWEASARKLDAIYDELLSRC